MDLVEIHFTMGEVSVDPVEGSVIFHPLSKRFEKMKNTGHVQIWIMETLNN